MRRSLCGVLLAGAVGTSVAQPATTLDREQIVDELGPGQRLAPMNRCGDATGQFGARVKIVVTPDGRVEDVEVASTDKDLRECMASRIRGARFPTTTHGATFGYEYRFRGVYPTIVARPIPASAVGPDPCEPVGALVAQEAFDDALALLAKLPACKGDRDRVVQRAIAHACKHGDAARAVTYAKQTTTVWLDGAYACRDARIRLPREPATGSLHVGHGRGHQWLEVAIDGENYGSPPINAGHLRVGRHRVEIWDTRTNTRRRAVIDLPANRPLHLDARLASVR